METCQFYVLLEFSSVVFTSYTWSNIVFVYEYDPNLSLSTIDVSSGIIVNLVVFFFKSARICWEDSTLAKVGASFILISGIFSLSPTHFLSV